jgi:hypothetical protein
MPAFVDLWERLKLRLLHLVLDSPLDPHRRQQRYERTYYSILRECYLAIVCSRMNLVAFGVGKL